MQDLISRRAAIDAVKQREWLTEDAKEILEEVLTQLPPAQPEPHWIPCSERYPDMDERVLVYTGAHEYHVWDCMSNRADNYFWEDEEGLYHGKYEVDLWMPLPEPYKGGDADDQR